MTIRTYLVEDTPVIREHLIGFFEDDADSDVVACASTEQEAIAWLQKNPDEWDLTVVDLFLEGGNGLGVVEAVKGRRADQKVVVLSNYATPEMRERSSELGADAFFDKSAEIDSLLAYCQALHQQRN